MREEKTTTTSYISDDGEIFFTKEQCIDHENITRTRIPF